MPGSRTKVSEGEGQYEIINEILAKLQSFCMFIKNDASTNIRIAYKTSIEGYNCIVFVWQGEQGINTTPIMGVNHLAR